MSGFIVCCVFTSITVIPNVSHSVAQKRYRLKFSFKPLSIVRNSCQNLIDFTDELSLS